MEESQINKSFQHIDIPNFRQIQNPNFLLPAYQLLRRNTFKPFVSNLKQFSNKKDEGMYIHKVIEEYLIKRIQTPDMKSGKWVEKFGNKWILIVIEKIINYMQQRGLENYKVEYVTTNSSLTKRFDAIFHDKNFYKLCIIDWKYSDWSFDSILKLDQQHFKDQLFEAMKQFNTNNITLIVVPLKQIHNFTIQEITSDDLFKTVKQMPFDLNTLNFKYQQYYNQIIYDQKKDILLQQSQIGVSKKKNQLLYENIINILQINSQKQIHYYLNLDNLNNDIQPKNKDQFWIIHVFLSEILVKQNELFQNILNDLEKQQSINQITQKQVSPTKEIFTKTDINQLTKEMNCLSLTQSRGYTVICFEQQEYLGFRQ